VKGAPRLADAAAPRCAEDWESAQREIREEDMKLLHGLAALPFLTAAALAQPIQLTDRQMDKVSAGFFEVDRGNTSVTVLSLWRNYHLGDDTPNFVKCSSCYLVIDSPTFSFASSFYSRSPFSIPEGNF
jgi:hypothetical protein